MEVKYLYVVDRWVKYHSKALSGRSVINKQVHLKHAYLSSTESGNGGQ